ncbi:MAG: hypothetical protein NC179_06020, partial [[Eubacterium] siraeum]|nr:hypothetical protein [[Eubacterium] siraeum]
FKVNGGGVSLSDTALNSVKTTLKVSGQYIYTREGETPEINNVTTIFGTNAVNLLETTPQGEVNYDDVYVDKDGKLAMPYHTLNNEIAYQYPAGDEDFAEYGNPFKALSVADFEATAEPDVFALTDASKMKVAATAITGYNESIASFTVTVEDDKVIMIDITTERIKRGSDENEFYYVATYSLSVSDWGTAEVDSDKLNPYATAPEHTALKEALSAAYDAHNYKIHVYEIEPYSDYEDVEYYTYVTDTAIYYDCLDWEEGYVEMGDAVKSVYPFDYDPETYVVNLYDPSKNFPTLRSMRASFNKFNDFAPEVFEYQTEQDGSVTYTLHYDVNTTDNVRNVLLNFADGIDVIRLYTGYTYDVIITVKDGALHQVALSYLVGDAYVIRTLTYSDFDNTAMPISFDNCHKVSVLDEYAGTYTDGTITLVVDDEGITINGADYDVTDYSIQYDMFTGDWNGGEWYIARTSLKQLVLLNLDEDITYVLTSTAIDPVEIPSEFVGVWKGETNSNVSAFAYGKIELNGKMLKVLSYDEKEGLYAIDGNYTYRFLADEIEDEPVVSVIVYEDGISSSAYVLYKDDQAVLIPEVLVGTWEKEEYDHGYLYPTIYKAVVGLTTVSLNFDGNVPTVTIVSITNNGYTELTLDVDGVEYGLAEGYSSSQIEIYSIAERFSVTLDKVEESEVQPPAVEIPDTFYGTYAGSDNKGTQYIVTISESGIVVNIDGVDYNAVVTEYGSEYDELLFELNSGEYCITHDDLNPLAIYFANTDYDSYANYIYGTFAPYVEIPASWYGTYSYDNEGDLYTVSISASGVAVEIGGVEKTVVVLSYDSSFGGTITINMDDEDYYIAYKSQTEMYFNNDDFSVNLILVKSSDNGGIEIPDSFIGTFEGTDYINSVPVQIIITQDGIEVSINGEVKSASVEKIEEVLGVVDFYIIVDGMECKIYNTSGNSYLFSSVTDDGESLYAMISKQA